MIDVTAEAINHELTPRDRINWQQLRALVSIQMACQFRSTLSTSTGKTRNVWLGLILPVLLMGFFFINNTRLFDDLESYIMLLFFVTISMISLNTFPDAVEVRQRNMELLHSKPINQRTLFAVELIMTLMIVSLLVSVFALPPLLTVRLYYPCSWTLSLMIFLMLIIGAAATSMIWQMGILMISQWVSLDRLRSICQLGLIMILLPTGAFNFMLVFLIRKLGGLSGSMTGRISLTNYPILKLLPSSWFADLLLGNFDLITNLERLGVVGIILLALQVLRMEAAQQRQQLMEKLLQPKHTIARPGLLMEMLTAISRRQIFGKPLIEQQRLGVAVMVLSLSQRDDQAKALSRSMLSTMVLLFLVGLVLTDPGLTLVLLPAFSVSLLIDSIKACWYDSNNARASWSLHCSPLSAIDIVKGMRVAIMLKVFILPLLMVAITIFLANSPITAILLVAAFIVSARAMIPVLICLKPNLPFSIDQKYAASYFLTVMVSIIFNMVGMIGYLIIWYCSNSLGVIGIGICLMVIGTVLSADYFITRLAANRLAEQQYRY